jgi:hypothetical protein
MNNLLNTEIFNPTYLQSLGIKVVPIDFSNIITQYGSDDESYASKKVLN